MKFFGIDGAPSYQLMTWLMRFCNVYQIGICCKKQWLYLLLTMVTIWVIMDYHWTKGCHMILVSTFINTYLRILECPHSAGFYFRSVLMCIKIRELLILTLPCFSLIVHWALITKLIKLLTKVWTYKHNI